MNDLILNSGDYREKIKESSLLKEEKVLLKELISCFLNKETPPQISVEIYQRFIKKLPKIILNKEIVVVRHINTDVHRIFINSIDSSTKEIPFTKRRKSIFQKTKSRRRVLHTSF